MKVTFCGHSEIAKKLNIIIKDLISKGATEFLLGGYGDFDILCAKTVRSRKQYYPNIKGILILTHPQKKYSPTL